MMDNRRMDPSGSGMTQAGKIMGLIGLILSVLAMVGGVLVQLAQIR